MAPMPGTPPRRPTSSRPRSSRPKSAGPVRTDKSTPVNTSSEPPQKKLRYIPGGPGGGGRYVDEDGTEIPVGGTGPGGYNYVGPRGRIGQENKARGLIPQVYPRRERTSRTTRTVLPRSQQPPMRFSSAAQAAAVVQSDGYKPREERAWEEFHPNLDIEQELRAFSADEVEGIVDARPVTPIGQQNGEGSASGTQTPNGLEGSSSKSIGISTPTGSLNGEIPIPGVNTARRPGRPPKNPELFFTQKAREQALLGKSQGKPNLTPKRQIPKVIPPVTNTNAKEKLTLPTPTHRLSTTLAELEKKSTFVDKGLANVGYQQSDIFERPEDIFIKLFDANLDEDLDLSTTNKGDDKMVVTLGGGGVGRVEYDMDEQDDKWLEEYNMDRKAECETISREVFEITITKIEKEWYALEKRIPKPNPKPPQTHRPRSSSAAAVNGEPQAGEEQDSKCAICDDGDCENTNAIVFCDGCDLAVHQECYGVPFIPEGQWLCRKCQLIGRGIPTCIFCPNTDGAFKQTNGSKWAHLLCAMWIPEVSLGNHTFMEPVMEVEKVPRTRWKLTCYLCQQKMGACIQCGNKSCYQAFHVTCARRARLFLKMKNNHGTLAVLDGNTVLKAFCDKHCPPDYAKENSVAAAAKDARLFYKRTMRGRLWADSQASALAMAATHQHAVTEHQPNESQLTGAKVALTIAESKKKGSSPQKAVWRLPSGAPVIPKICYDNVEKSLQRFNIHKRKEYVADACRYWTLKREARRGAALLKRLQLQMETFSSMEITRRNFAAMGPSGRSRLIRRIEFVKHLMGDLEKLQSLSSDVLAREAEKLGAARMEREFVDTVYFPVARLLPPIIHKALKHDIRGIFRDNLLEMDRKVFDRFYTTATAFVHDIAEIFRQGIINEPIPKPETAVSRELEKGSTIKKVPLDLKERRKLGKRIIRAIQQMLEEAVRTEANITSKPVDAALKELEQILESAWQTSQDTISVSLGESASIAGEADRDVEMTEAENVTDGIKIETDQKPEAADTDMQDVDAADDEAEVGDVIVAESDTKAIPESGNNTSPSKTHTHGSKNSTDFSNTNGYGSSQPNPPTPPLSNGEGTATEGADILEKGGVPWYVKDYDIIGTSAVSGNDVLMNGSDLSEMGDDEVNALGESADIVPAVMASASKTKKGKAKKKSRSRR